MKSPNILIIKSPAGDIESIKLADVGIACPEARSGTQKTSEMGSAAWMSPEVVHVSPHGMYAPAAPSPSQSLFDSIFSLLPIPPPPPSLSSLTTGTYSRSTYTSKADVYSFGVVVWELLTRKRPHHDMHAVFIIYQVAIGGLSLPIPEDGPDYQKRLFRVCTQHDPARRPTMRDVINDLNLIHELGDDLTRFAVAPAGEDDAYRAMTDMLMSDEDVQRELAGFEAGTRAAVERLLHRAVTKIMHMPR